MKALISTLSASDGGVPSMIEFVVNTLKAGGIDAELAYYQPYRWSPELSVPSYCLLHRRVKARRLSTNGRIHNEIGAWLPELEFTHYLPTKHWKHLIQNTDFHLSVSGSCLAATPFAVMGIPFWSWVATPWEADRVQRIQGYLAARKLLDRWIDASVCRLLERSVLSKGTIVALSEYTRTHLEALAKRDRPVDVMPSGVDTACFKNESAGKQSRNRIGFVGRSTDARKNINLLLSAVDWCRRHGTPALELVLIGDDGPGLRKAIADHSLQNEVVIVERVDHSELPAHLSTMDIFVIPSHQEGLCIAALEAMSCGVPVLSTPCGGPAEFVIDGQTGFIVEPVAQVLGRNIQFLLDNPDLRAQLRQNTRRLVEEKYSIDAARQKFWSSFTLAFAGNPAAATARATAGCSTA